ncbi:MAG TPA: hydroxyacylglutathione hydrolase [Rhodocyclaceae bacterium]|nr:hydroxyacylglutathione hydrolase [Rhodocyclaceae bacterium]
MSKDLDIVPIAAFSDNYIWLLRRGRHAAVVDPGDAAPVLAHLEQHRLELAAILVTHHHGDHIGGIEALLAHSRVPVFGPAGEAIDEVDRQLKDGDRVELPELDTSFEVIAVPGHTRGHIAYYGRNPSACGVLFCGDTLFACGCGRVFEGTPQQMWRSLARIAALPPDTRIYCAHEYTQANIRFALAVEPDNAALRARAEAVARLRAAATPTVPSTLAEELATNPFLRWDAPAVIASAARAGGSEAEGPEAVFAAIREWKNKF